MNRLKRLYNHFFRKTKFKNTCGSLIAVDPNWDNIGSIRISDGEIRVSPRFEKLQVLQQELIITQLILYREHGDIFKADKEALEKMMTEYPKVKKSVWYDMFLTLFQSKVSELNLKRAERLITEKKDQQ